MSAPLVSIVIPCFNQGRYLDAALGSALAQTWPHIEVLVVDDGSTDQTRAVLQEAVRLDPRVTAISTANRGLGAARNRGLSEARGVFVNVLDADDLLHPEKIARQANVLVDTPDVGVVLCDVDFIDDRGDTLPGDGLHLERLDDPDAWFDTLLTGGLFPPHAPLVRRTLVDGVGGFSEDRTVAGHADYLIWLSIAARGARLHVLPEVLASYRRQAGSMSQDRAHMHASRCRALARLAAETPDRVGQAMARLGDEVDAMRAATGALTAICRAQQARLIEIERERVALRLSAALGERPDAPVLIWGTGTKGREVAARLARLPRRPRAFIDSASERWGQQVDGVPVMSPDDALRTRDPLVVVASMYADEIGQMLRTRGVHDFVVAP